MTIVIKPTGGVNGSTPGATKGNRTSMSQFREMQKQNSSLGALRAEEMRTLPLDQATTAPPIPGGNVIGQRNATNPHLVPQCPGQLPARRQNPVALPRSHGRPSTAETEALAAAWAALRVSRKRPSSKVITAVCGFLDGGPENS
jgi:hypothetical protein